MTAWVSFCFVVVVVLSLWQSRQLRKANAELKRLEARLARIKTMVNTQYGKYAVPLHKIPLYSQQVDGEFNFPVSALKDDHASS